MVAFCVAGVPDSSSAGTPRRCKGTKIWFANDCRYPDEIERLKGQQANQRRAQTHQREADAKACREARAAGTSEAWRGYLATHPKGSCHEEAASRIEEAGSAAEPAPPPETAPPETAPPAQQPPAEQPAPPTTRPEGDDGGISPWAWVGFGVGAAGLLTWGITGGASMSMSSDITDDCLNDVCPTDREGDVDTAKALAHVATAGFVIGVAGVAVGVIALVATAGSDRDGGGSSAEASDPPPRIAVSPLVGPGYLGMSGTF